MLGLPDQITTCLFDLDGVLTKTAVVHDAAWKDTFDALLRKRDGDGFRPFDPVSDYDDYVDGKPREDGVRDFLASRGITLPEGEPDDPPDADTVYGVGNRKNVQLTERIRRDGVQVYDGSVRYLRAVKAAGLHRVVVSSSANTEMVLRTTGLAELVEGRVDGVTLQTEHLHGKPAPDSFLAGAKLVGARPEEAVVFEDALSGVAAGRAGHFGWVVGVDRVGQAAELKTHGADVVVTDLAQLLEPPGDHVVIRQSEYPVEPWHVRELGLNLDLLAQSESVFALSNGHIGVRGNLDEGEPNGLPGTYLNSFYDLRPLPYAEAGYGYPESGQTIVNVTNGKLIRLLVDDEPFDLRYGHLIHHERILDLRDGTLRRIVEWESPSGRVVRVRSTRLVSLTQRSIFAVHYEVEAVGKPTRIVLQSELVANEHVEQHSTDPRVAAAQEHPLEAQEHSSSANRAMLIHTSRSSKLIMAAAADHILHGVPESNAHTYTEPDWARTTVGTQLQPGEKVAITKFVAYGWSSQRSLPAIRDQVDAALSAVVYTGWDALLKEQQAYVTEFWDGADVEVVGDDGVQQAVRFGLWHVLQAGARAEERALPAKGLTGPGYDGHAFWDTESYVLPVLIATAPKAASDALRWRFSTLDLAVERAKTLGLAGAAFPWRTIRGQECSAYWPAGTAAFHVNADVAAAAVRYVQWTGDAEFDRECALPILVATARLWASLGFHGDDGKFHIDGVTGPDEYSAIVDDNTYTNLVAARNLRYAAEAVLRWPDDAAKLDVTAAEVADWQRADQTMAVPYDERLGVYQQDRGSTERQVWDFAKTAAANAYPLLLNAPYFDIYRKQVIKQADLVMALHWCGDSFTVEDKAKAFAYYEPLTVRDSSLSACTQAIISAEVGHLELAHDYLTEASLMDLRDLEHNTRDGVHVASLAGSWLAVVCGFGGLRDHGGRLTFAPRLPTALQSLMFSIRWHGCKVRVAVTQTEATYSITDGDAVELPLHHHGEPFTVTNSTPVTLPIAPAVPLTPRPEQPAGRTPLKAYS